jgi:phage baseplate assembly protein W
MSREAQNLLIPFRRDKKRDFARAAARRCSPRRCCRPLMTEGATPRSSGELPWRTNFGAGLALLRHQRNDAALAELARVHVRDALKRWVPEAELVEPRRHPRGRDALTLRVRFRPRARANAAVAEVIER